MKQYEVRVASSTVSIYTLHYRASPVWPDANFYCPDTPPGAPCQDFYEHDFTLDVNLTPCVPDPQVDAAIWPNDKNETFSLNMGSEVYNIIYGVSNGECGYEIKPYQLVDSADSF